MSDERLNAIEALELVGMADIKPTLVKPLAQLRAVS
jgi:hypothetical protein